MKLLLIEDNKDTAQTLKEELKSNYIVEISKTGREGEYQAKVNDYDLIILDLGLPDANGIEVCRKIRAGDSHIPILILTGDSELESKVSLLDCGADDYLTKPFKIPELKARIRALLRRGGQNSISNSISIGDLTLDLDKKTVKRGKNIFRLRRKEFYLLEYLAKNAGMVLSRSMIFDHVWESDSDCQTNVVDVHIKYLRDQIDKSFDEKLIKTVHGIGYKIEA